MYKLFLFFLFILAGCSGGSKQEIVNKDTLNYANDKIQEDRKIEHANINRTTEIDEVLDLDSVLLNNLLKFSSSQLEVKAKLGEPDSITTPDFECGGYVAGEEPWSDIVRIWHYQGTKIVAFKDRAELMMITLKESGFTLNHPRIVLSKNTLLSDLAKVFPNSVEEAYDSENSIDKKTYKLVRIAPKPSSDDQWVLTFYNDKLVEIEYWIGC